MSAIYGMYHWGQEGFVPVQAKMEEPLHQYKIDKFASETVGNVEFGCGVQYFTQESEREILPYYDKMRGIFLTADVVLDNRKELRKQLGIPHPNVPDGVLLLESYAKWGEEFVKLLRGVFAIAIYDRNKQCLFLYTDHTGSRAVNYYNSKEGFLFGTTLSSILKVCPDIPFNEKWIAGCEASQTPDMEIFPEITPYEKVFQLEAGMYLKVSEHSLEKKEYWNPKYRKEQISFSDSKCRKMFLETFSKCVKDVLRSRRNTAATVSSGLDSTSVASLAAGYLERQGKKLYSFTSIPDKEVKVTDGSVMTNESWGPALLAEKYTNMEVQMVSCQGMDGFTKLERLVKQLEIPTKSAPNVMWLDEIYSMAAKKDCKLLLKGQYGNATISYGKILGNIRYQLTHWHFVRAYREIKAFSRLHGIPEKKIVKKYIRELWGERKKENFLGESYLKKELLQKYEINVTVNQLAKESGGSMADTQEQMRNFQFDRVNLAQLGLYDTKFSLIHGVLLRDPTKDKRMIELCMSLPVECYAHNGVERRLVREYMRGIVPDAILKQVRKRGKQSADYVERVLDNWNDIKQDVTEKLSNEELLTYLDEKQLKKMMEDLEHLDCVQNNRRSFLVACAFNFYACSVFLQRKE